MVSPPPKEAPVDTKKPPPSGAVTPGAMTTYSHGQAPVAEDSRGPDRSFKHDEIKGMVGDTDHEIYEPGTEHVGRGHACEKPAPGRWTPRRQAERSNRRRRDQSARSDLIFR